MTRWLIWAALLVSTSSSSTAASRARNTNSYGYHAVAALFSHGTFFVAQLIGIDLIVEIIRKHDGALALKGFLVYAVANTAGSLAAHWLAIHHFEKGDRRVGAYRETL